MINDHDSLKNNRKHAALFIINALNADKENSESIWKEIHKHAFINISGYDKSKELFNSINLLKELQADKNLFTNQEELYENFYSGTDSQTENLFFTINQLNLSVQERDGINYPRSFQNDSGFDSEEINSNNNVDKPTNIQSLVEKIFEMLINCEPENLLLETGIKSIKNAAEIHIEVTNRLNLLVKKAIEEIPSIRDHNKCFQVEKILRIIQEISRGHYTTALCTVQILDLKITNSIDKILIGQYTSSEYNNLFYFIKTEIILLKDFQQSFQENLRTDKKKILCSNNNNNNNSVLSKQLSSEWFSLLKKLNKNIDKNLELLQNRYHLAQVWILLKNCSHVVHKILKNCI